MKPNKLRAEVDWIDDDAPEAQVRAGFLGRSARRGQWRLYLRLDLTEYIEFGVTDLIHFEHLSPQQSPLGGSVVWLRPDAKVVHTGSSSQRQQASFLSGPVTSGFLSRTPGISVGTGGFSPETIVETVISFLLSCPSHWLGCTNQCTVQCGSTLVGVCPIYTFACTYERRICG